MVQELRQIILSKDELLLAIDAHRRIKPGLLPDGKIIDFEVAGQTSIRVTIAGEDETQTTSVVFSDAKLLDALIRFCLENNIMLPRLGRKSVSVLADNVSLCIMLDVDTYLMNGEPWAATSFFALAGGRA